MNDVFQSLNLRTALVFAGITPVRRHDTRRSTARPFDLQLTKRSLAHGVEDFTQIRSQTDEYCLRLRVTKPYVILEQFWSILRQHQAEKQNALERKSFPLRAGKRGLNYLADHMRQQTIIENGRVSNTAHPARVRTGIVFTYSLMIARRGH